MSATEVPQVASSITELSLLPFSLAAVAGVHLPFHAAVITVSQLLLC